MLDRLAEIRARALQELEAVSDLELLEAGRVGHLGRKAPLTQLLRQLGNLPLEERRRLGAAANEAKALLEARLTERERALKEQETGRPLEGGRVDVPPPRRPLPP